MEKNNDSDKTQQKANNNKNDSKDMNKNEIIIEDKNKNEIIIEDNNKINENKEYFDISFAGFKSHYDNCESAIQNDIKNIKKNKNMPNNRDLLWQLFLGVLPYQSSANWNQIISDERISYYDTKKKLINKDIEEFILTKKIKDKYSLYFKFKDILSKEDYNFLDIIKVDVTRTFQNVQLFKEEKIQIMLINILFVFAKNNCTF